MTHNHRDRATRHLETVQNLRRALLDAYAERPTDPALIAQLHQDIGASMKLAQIHAELATADAVTDLGSDLIEALRNRADVVLDAQRADLRGVGG